LASPKNLRKATSTPTFGAPLRGLEHLSRVALHGREAVLAKAREPVPYVWQDVAVNATIVVLAGGPGEGKTTLLFLILAARLAFEEVTLLGRAVRRSRDASYVVLIEGEHAEGSASRKLVRSLDLLGVDHEAIDRIIIIARKAVLLGSPVWKDVEKLVAAGLVSDIALDTIARVAPGDQNDEREQVAIFDVVARTIDAAPSDEAKPVCWAVAHTRKNGGGELADVSGSTQRVGQADTVLLVQGEKQGGRTVSSTVTFAKLREEPDNYPQPATFAIAGGRIVCPEGNAKDERPLETRIMELLSLGPKTKNALREKTGAKRETVEAALDTLFAERRIEGVLVKVRGKETRAFQVRAASANGARIWPDPGRTGEWPDGGRTSPDPREALS
jgi:hypothetical protein